MLLREIARTVTQECGGVFIEEFKGQNMGIVHQSTIQMYTLHKCL